MNDFFGGTQFGGAGFMPSPAPGGDGAYGGDQKSGKRAGGPKPPESIRAVSVIQLVRDCQKDEDNYVLDGRVLTNITLVGRIIDVAEANNKITYKVHDGTGILDLSMYTQEDDEVLQRRKAQLVPNTYVRAFGTVRKNFNNDGIGMTAFSIKPIEDFNEVTYHNLQVIMQHLHFTRGAAPPPGQTMATPQPAGQYGGYNSGGPAYGGAPGHGMAPQGTALYGQAPQQHQQHGAGGDPCAEACMQIFHAPENRSKGDGLNVNDLISILAGRFNPQQIRTTLSFLANEGHLYTTIGDDWYKLIE